MNKEQTLVFILKKERKGSGTSIQYTFVGDNSLIKEMEMYFLERQVKKLRE